MSRHFTVRDFENLSRGSKSSLINVLKHEDGGIIFQAEKIRNNSMTMCKCENC